MLPPLPPLAPSGRNQFARAVDLSTPSISQQALPVIEPDTIRSTAKVPPRALSKENKPVSKPVTRGRELDPALLSQQGWVLPERDVKIRKNGRPPIWAVGRQELCESLPYFQSYQGGHYDRKERCHGYLLDGYPSVNDRCVQGGRVIISHGGGNSHATTAGYVLHSNQERNNVRMRALQNCLDRKVPVVLLAGSQYSFFPRLKEMGVNSDGASHVRYCVLGAYFVTHIWAEGEPVVSDPNEPIDRYFVRFKVRFEWVKSQGTPWFADVIGKDSQVHVLHPHSRSFPDSTSLAASDPVKWRLQLLWMSMSTGKKSICYNETCPRFFRLEHGQLATPAQLDYDPSILNLSSVSGSPMQNALIPQPLEPRTLQSLVSSQAIRDHSRSSWRGFGCSECGRLSSRSEWLILKCHECGARVDATGVQVTIQTLRLKPKHMGKATVASQQVGDPILCYPPEVVQQTLVKPVEGYKGHTFVLGNDAKVHHLWPDNPCAFVEADRLFQDYQGKAAGQLFKRNPLNCHRTQGSLLCQQFTWNGGQEYLHAIAVDTYPFAPESADSLIAAPCAQDACEFLKRIVPLVVSRDKAADTIFNEILSVAYMEGGKMNYHDDGEVGLGSVVASISLGSDAVMSFRPREKKKDKNSRPNALAANVMATNAKSRGSKAILKLRLAHGDILVMEGAGVQKHFEHAVEPKGLRFAATARLVGPDHVRRGRTVESKEKKHKIAFGVSPTEPSETTVYEPFAGLWPPLRPVMRRSRISLPSISALAPYAALPLPPSRQQFHRSGRIEYNDATERFHAFSSRVFIADSAG
ncbi:uncharacterized protein JCM15063_001191 [Sporobolomyces koalae]|uniref:uncharacterized protein n=1 Tax=Sporobolomyces koalae TaxID=500713 RepID=UPI00317A7AE3